MRTPLCWLRPHGPGPRPGRLLGGLALPKGRQPRLGDGDHGSRGLGRPFVIVVGPGQDGVLRGMHAEPWNPRLSRSGLRTQRWLRFPDQRRAGERSRSKFGEVRGRRQDVQPAAAQWGVAPTDSRSTAEVPGVGRVHQSARGPQLPRPDLQKRRGRDPDRGAAGRRRRERPAPPASSRPGRVQVTASGRRPRRTGRVGDADTLRTATPNAAGGAPSWQRTRRTPPLSRPLPSVQRWRPENSRRG